MPKGFSSLEALLLNPKAPLAQRKQMLGQLCVDDAEAPTQIVEKILTAAASGSAESIYKKKMKKVDEVLQQLEQGPQRTATFLGLLEAKSAIRRACVVLEDGSTVTLPVPDEKLAKALERGDTVWLDQQAKALLFRDPQMPVTGEEARLERLLPGGQVEITLREHERMIFRTSQALSVRPVRR